MKKMLDATALQYEAISSNLANAEKPGYKRIDLDASFSNELKRAIGDKDSQQIASLRPTIGVDANAVANTKDGNTVQLEEEMLLMHRSVMAHAVETQLVTGHLLRLRLAITGRPS